MAEYIEREAVMERLKAHIKRITPLEESRDMFYHDSGMNGAITGAVLEVKKAPAADVAPVVHGRWEVVHGVLTPGGDPLLRCPICKARESEHLCGVECRTVWHYCPNCGARMDGE